MAFPATALPVRSRLFIGGQWVDFSSSTLIREPITIGRGIPDYGVRADPSRCSLSLKNPSGVLSPRLPTGTYYGLFGQNTPLQVVLDEASDTFSRTSSNGWGTSSSGQTWATSGGVAGDFAVSGGNATISISAVNSFRITALNVSVADCDVVASVKPGVVATGDQIYIGPVLRYQDDSNLYWVAVSFSNDSTVTVLIVKRVGGVNTVVASSNTLGYYIATSQWRVRAKICGRVITARAWDATRGTEPSTFDIFYADTATDAILTAGKVGIRTILGVGNTNTLPVSVTTSSLEVVHHRWNGEVPVWPLDWNLAGTDVWTSIEGAGILRRINKSKESFSAIRRVLKSFGNVLDSVVGYTDRRPKAYWSLEEEDGSTIASSGLPDGQPMTVSGTVDWASISSMVGSDPLPDMMNGPAVLVGSVPVQDTLTGTWTVGAAFTPPTLSANWTALAWKAAGAAFERFELRLTGTLDLYGINGTTATLLASLAYSDLAQRPTFVMVKAETSGSDTTFRIVTTDANYTLEIDSATYTAAGTVPGYPTEVSVFSVTGGASDTAGIGHVTVWDGTFFLLADTQGADIVSAVQGNNGDYAIARLRRLLERQEQLPFIYFGSESERLGPQRSARLSDLIDDVMVVDKGLFYEARDENAVVFVPRVQRYNQTVTLALTYGSSGHVARGFKPVEDDRDVVNDLTVVRDGGASGRYEKRTGRKSVNAPPDGSYRNPQQKTLPLYDDSQPYQHAAWETNVAVWDEARYRSVRVDMARSARDASTIYEQAKRVDVGSRLTVASPPAWLPPDLIDLHSLGLVEQIGGGQRIGAYAWSITASTVPAGPYTVGVLDTASLDKLQTAGCELMVNRTTVDTSFTVHTSVLPKWKTGAGLSIALIQAGERMTATTIANVTPSFVAAGTAAHGNNASLNPGLPAGLAGGDLLLLFAGIRNSGTGFPWAPDSSWDTLLDMGNAKLFGKYAQSGESTPAVDFVAGTTNATTSAQTAAFRGVGRTVVNRATQLNGSAQNIAYPALTIARDNCLVLYLGWKQDDWTSVATIAGATEIGEPSSTTGDDQGLAWGYLLQGTAANIAAGSFVVTGGTSQINRGGVIALASDVQTLTVTRSVNSVVKAQTARTAIKVYQAFRPGL